MVTMLVVDDEYYIRKGIRETIDWASVDVCIVGEAGDGEEGLELASNFKPDLILMDINMPFVDGLEMMERLREEQLDCGVIVLSGYDEFEYAQKAIQYGVMDYLLKPVDKESLTQTVAKAARAIRERRSTRHYQQLVAQETSVLQVQFLQDLMRQAPLTPEEITQKSLTLNLTFGRTPMQLVHIRLDDYELLEHSADSAALSALQGVLEGLIADNVLLGSNYLGSLVSTAPGEWAAILSYLENASADKVAQEIQERFKKLLSSASNTFGHTLSLSVSGVFDSLDQVGEVYLETKKRNKKLLPGVNSLVFPDGEEDSSLRKVVREALALIRRHYAEDITLQKVADTLYVSPSHLMHLFRSDLDKTFNSCLTEYRIEAAKELMREPGHKIREVAEKVGYTDVKHFNKLFKKKTGFAPTEYVKVYYAER